jgi:hypothetical protein
MNINGFGVKKINTVLRFEIIQYRENRSKILIRTMRQVAGEIINFPKDNITEDVNDFKFEYYGNFTKDGNQPLLISDVVPNGGATYYVDCLSVDVPKSYAEIVLTSDSQEVQRSIYIISDVPLYFSVNNYDDYTFIVDSSSENISSGKIRYKCSFSIDGMECSPGEVSCLNPKLLFYTDQNKEIKVGECSINIKVFHKKFETIQYREHISNKLIKIMIQEAGEIIKLPTDNYIKYDNTIKFEYYRNFTKDGNQPLLIEDVVPDGGATYYLDCLTVDVSRSYAEIYLTRDDQTVQSCIDIISNVPLYLSINNYGAYSFTVNSSSENISSGKIKYTCSFSINGMECDPGEVSYLNPTLLFYADQNKQNKLGECLINIKVSHESNGDPD